MSITVITGPMFAGKTTYLLQLAHGREKALYVKHAIDTRYSSDHIATHDGVQQRAYQTNDLSSLDIAGIDTICIDEGHFFAHLAQCCEQWAHVGIDVFVAGLISNRSKEPFTNMTNLLPKADRLHFLHARCACGQVASFTKQLVQSDTAFLVGGKEHYAPTCRACFEHTPP